MGVVGVWAFAVETVRITKQRKNRQKDRISALLT